MMNKKIKYAVIFITLITLTTFHAMAGPQDNWYIKRVIPYGTVASNSVGNPYGLELTTNSELVVADSHNDWIQRFDLDGNYITNWSCPGDVTAITLADNGLYYTVGDFNQVLVYDSTGGLANSWGSIGVADGFFNQPNDVAVSTNLEVYVADTLNHRIQVFNSTGTFQRKWGSVGSDDNQFQFPYGVDIGPGGLIYVADSSNKKIKIFTESGTFVRSITTSQSPSSLGVSSQGISAYHASSWMIFHDYASNVIQTLSTPQSITVASISKDASYACYNLNGEGVRLLKRGYRTMEAAATTNLIPDPVIYGVTQRMSSSWVDIDFSIEDPDDATVDIAALAFAEGNTNLISAIEMSTFEEGSGGAIGSSKATGVRTTLTWNAGADWPTNFSTVQIEILAKDNRDLLGLHYITIPSNGPDPQLIISRSPVTANEMMDVWTWLVASGDSEVGLSSGIVSAVSGPFNGSTLAISTDSQSLTTTNGVSFMADRLGIRLATTGEVARAKESTSIGTITAWEPRTQIGGHPKKVNEYGFDTGTWTTNAWWFAQ